MSTRFDLDDKEWALIEPLLPTGLCGTRRTDDRRIMKGIFYVLRAGCPWRDLPARYGLIPPVITATIVGLSVACGSRSSTRWREGRKLPAHDR